MKIEDIQIGDKVVYVPKHLLIGPSEQIVKVENLGVVTSKNENYVFVQYRLDLHSKATRAEDLFSLKDRPDVKVKAYQGNYIGCQKGQMFEINTFNFFNFKRYVR